MSKESMDSVPVEPVESVASDANDPTFGPVEVQVVDKSGTRIGQMLIYPTVEQLKLIRNGRKRRKSD